MRYALYIPFIALLGGLFFNENPLDDGKNRPNITFIVGEDAEQENHYYAAAKKYYSTHDADNQSLVVDTCRSLVAIQQFLNAYPTKNNKAWGKINIVAHGNEWTGLKLSIVPNVKERVNTTTLKKALYNNLLQNLKRCRKLDKYTHLEIKGCAVGKDEILLEMMKKAFGGRLEVTSPEKFVVYQADNQCYLADYFYSFHHPDSSFNKANAVQELKIHYPKTVLDWNTILSENTVTPMRDDDKSVKGGDVKNPFVYRFKIPVRWTVNFSDSTQVPTFPNPQGLQFEDWLFQQNNLMSTLDKTHLPKEAFRWVYDTVGSSMKIYGVCQVVCVLKPEEKLVF
jgi:hypothetical protein